MRRMYGRNGSSATLISEADCFLNEMKLPSLSRRLKREASFVVKEVVLHKDAQPRQNAGTVADGCDRPVSKTAYRPDVLSSL